MRCRPAPEFRIMEQDEKHCGCPRGTPGGQTGSPETPGARLSQTSPVWRSQTRSACWSPVAVFRIDVGELHAAAWLSHHRCDGIPPFLIMPRFLVSGGSILGAIGFNQEKTGGIVGLLENVEARDA